MATTLIQSTFDSIKSGWKTMSIRQRILKEYRTLEYNKLPGIEVILTENLHQFYADLKITDNELYPNTYRLKISIPEDYPFVAPVVVFVRDEDEGINEIPIHPHIYSNGHICLDLLGPGWVPVQTVSSLLLSIQSILASNDRNERPPDDERYCKGAPKNPTKTRFTYHDETV